MKRKSTLILVLALALAVMIPVFAFAAGNGRMADTSSRTFGRGSSTAVQQGTQQMLQDCDEEDCDCEELGTGLGADGEALHQYWTDGQPLNLSDGTGAQGFARGGRGGMVNNYVNCPLAD